MQEKDHSNPIQSEMPFAIVDGEQITEMPKDLYIPPVALQVFLDTFEGPLDLLLYLIRKQNLNILDIPIADITEQYVDYINLMKELELELAGEYLLMAAMLAEIKSRLLLPIFEDIDEEEDPRAELIRRLLEYERYRTVSEEINQLDRVDSVKIFKISKSIQSPLIESKTKKKVSKYEINLSSTGSKNKKKK